MSGVRGNQGMAGLHLRQVANSLEVRLDVVVRSQVDADIRSPCQHDVQVQVGDGE